MAKDYFKVENTASLASLKQGDRIHVIGVCGVAMAQLAILLSKKGFNVSGSDKEFYQPMAGLLEKSAVLTIRGYDQSNITSDIKLVVIGNSASYGNPEVDAIERDNVPYTLFPKILDELVIGSRHSIVIAGTHGKSTTSAMTASMLYKMDKDPSYFIGGASLDLPESLHEGTGQFCVLEGDEYDSAFFAKVPKFAFYHADTCIINAIEYDHADIYPDLAAINAEFTKLVKAIPESGTALCCIDYKNCEALVAEWKDSVSCKILTFGEHLQADFVITKREQSGFKQKVFVESSIYENFVFELPLPGAYNAKNALAALIIARIHDLDMARAIASLATFQSVKRRLEILYQDNDTLLIEDFAHHPTAVSEAIKATKEAFPSRSIWAVFEPRSNTSRRKVFQDDYIQAFKFADYVILSEVEARATDAGQDLIEVKTLSRNIEEFGVQSVALSGASAIEEFILTHLRPQQVILVMSNGSFGGLTQRLRDALSKIRTGK